MIIAFDLDGTLADITHRLHFIQKHPKDWRAFFAACEHDKPIQRMCYLANTLLSAHRVEIWSGRSEEVRKQTEEWLRTHVGEYDALRMRSAGDYRPDDVVKAEWLDALNPLQRPLIAFDDRDRVVQMWRSRGVICCQVAPGDF